MSFFSVKGVGAGYGKRDVINDISFDLDKNCLVGILGANASGKTTLLKAICGILPHKGSCTLDGEILERLSPREIAKLCSYIPQRSGISIDICVLDVVLMGFNPQLGLLEQPTKAMREKALRILSDVGLADKENTDYLHLSEGQKQLCILARTLVSDSRLLLLDEPESALDFHFRYRMLDTLRCSISKEDRSALVTLHDPNLALNYCDKLLLLSEGKVFGEISPGSDSVDHMEKMLREIYGSVSLQSCMTRDGRHHFVMLKEDI